ncbi:MAG: peroxiredoxin family protein [Planctomyces sp.]
MLLTLLESLLPGRTAADDKTTEMQLFRYHGVLTQADDAEAPIVRRFEVLRLQHDGSNFFHVLDDPGNGCEWPESFGWISNETDDPSRVPHILYELDGTIHPVTLPPFQVNVPEDAAEGSEFEQQGLRMTYIGKKSQNQDERIEIEAREKRGRRQTLTVSAKSGDLRKVRAEVVVGRGDRLALTMEETEASLLSGDMVIRLNQLQNDLAALQKSLNRRSGTLRAELSLRQIELVREKIPAATEAATGTPLQELVSRISSDVEKQNRRANASITRAAEVMNSDAPDFSLNLIQGGTIDSESLRGHVVVLHFWDYRDQPLSEPYGQTGYLDFISNQRSRMKVKVLGVCTGQEFQSPDGLPKAKRSARKLTEFMNLTYPVAYDDGALLRAVGDPRESNGNLPLWVVLSADGKIAHYHAGFYEIDPAKGLQELDRAVIDQIRKTSEKKP